MASIKKIQSSLLDWYDLHRRIMPWRAEKGTRPDPYHVWLSEIMLQQTTVAAVTPYFTRFIEKWPAVQDLARAPLDEVLTAWAGLGYYARARNLHKCAQDIVQDHKGKFPETVESLLKFPGIGPYTAAAVSSIAFNRPAVAVDGNVERVVTRLFAIEQPLPLSKNILRDKAASLAKDNERPGDFTQAFMELGATVCTPRKPKCNLCPWRDWCAARKLGIAEGLPRKVVKKKKPVRYGEVFWVYRKDGCFCIHKRADEGLYGGMYQLPTSAWLEDKDAVADSRPLFNTRLKLKSCGLTIRHSLTHFDLVLEIWSGELKGGKLFEGALWVSAQDLYKYALPSLMKKAINLCL
jgi:A/G-specific adenine glycosylase